MFVWPAAMPRDHRDHVAITGNARHRGERPAQRQTCAQRQWIRAVEIIGGACAAAWALTAVEREAFVVCTRTRVWFWVHCTTLCALRVRPGIIGVCRRAAAAMVC